MNVADFYKELAENGADFFCGVPDSLLKDFCGYILDNVEKEKHIITANEGNAIALASGHYMATSKPAVVYMQNSGLGNAVNPLLSLTDKDVYNIPVLMIIGWRGEPQTKDEPQHITQGALTEPLLKCMGIEYAILSDDFKKAKSQLSKAFKHINKTSSPYALIVKKGTFDKYEIKSSSCNNYEMTREFAIGKVSEKLCEEDIVVATTGHISRELYEYRENNNQDHFSDFLTVGSMGHSSSIALGIALEKKDKNVYCFDGDGAVLMHLGALPVISSLAPDNLKHILFNNEAHCSVGAQPTCANCVDFKELVKSCGYKNVYSVKTEKELEKVLPNFIKEEGPNFLEIKVKTGARSTLGRPKEKPCENKIGLMNNILQTPTFLYQGAIEKLPDILKKEKAKKILLFTGKESYLMMKNQIEGVLKGFEIYNYNSFTPNPSEDEVKEAIKNIHFDFDIIVAVGGGSVIDFAKLYKHYKKAQNKKLIAVPTTAGTGSEETKFAVCYKDGVKISVEDISLLPDYSIVDSDLLKSLGKYQKGCCSLDAFCQAIEAFWSVNSTQVSDKYALESIKICTENIENYINTNDIKYAISMAKASNLSGKAINIAKTTASHALSYAFTSKHKIPHGHAVALSIAKLAEYNAKVCERNCNDPRGVDFVKSKIMLLQEYLSDDFEKYFTNLFEKTDVKYKLKDLKINNIEEITAQVNIERLSNNPVKLNQEELKNLFF